MFFGCLQLSSLKPAPWEILSSCRKTTVWISGVRSHTCSTARGHRRRQRQQIRRQNCNLLFFFVQIFFFYCSAKRLSISHNGYDGFLAQVSIKMWSDHRPIRRVVTFSLIEVKDPEAFWILLGDRPSSRCVLKVLCIYI